VAPTAANSAPDFLALPQHFGTGRVKSSNHRIYQ